MVDFNKLRQQQNVRMATLAGNSATSVRLKEKTELELLRELSETQDLNDWEQGFSDSCIRWLSGAKEGDAPRRLSQKQKYCLDKMVIKYNLKVEKEVSDMVVSPARSARIIPPNETLHIGNIDEDDIPF